MEAHLAEFLNDLGWLLLGRIARLSTWMRCSVVFLAFLLCGICVRRRILDLDDELMAQFIRAWKILRPRRQRGMRSPWLSGFGFGVGYGPGLTGYGVGSGGRGRILLITYARLLELILELPKSAPLLPDDFLDASFLIAAGGTACPLWLRFISIPDVNFDAPSTTQQGLGVRLGGAVA
ncbi:hypothetical protein HG531_011457 [Fusarium graminearum]|nr:hypothetical protein HG531_011457 [Fusarium graminearum]